MSGRRILVIGGAASGKSEYAEDLVCSFGPERLYLASAQAQDT
ncbi:bifunctional adenosylcobinamide kinase/adenosylcobinamide-phosphate guanylyltransferase, partial [Oceanicola sp. S124]